jgi:hypothetical protein
VPAPLPYSSWPQCSPFGSRRVQRPGRLVGDTDRHIVGTHRRVENDPVPVPQQDEWYVGAPSSPSLDDRTLLNG